MAAYVRDDFGKTALRPKVSLKIRTNQRQCALQAASFAARIFGLKPLGVALVFYT
jgi:hypothetical protein